jgi:hypothetical protein
MGVYRKQRPDESASDYEIYREVRRLEYNAQLRAYREANKEQRKAYDKAYNEANKDKNKANNIKRKYGLTPDEYKELTANGCEVCGALDRLCVDHDHTTGKVRGCLCSKCNQALGLLQEDLTTVKNLQKYMEVHK